jgi:hypothetical protein
MKLDPMKNAADAAAKARAILFIVPTLLCKGLARSSKGFKTPLTPWGPGV